MNSASELRNAAAIAAEDHTVAGRYLLKVVLASSLGTLIEYYDFLLYGSLAGILAAQFFPAANADTSFMLSIATFGTGFLARPIGALVFGRIGDTIGRKVTFILTLLLMGVATCLIGLLPTYQTWGLAAPLCLVALRLLQGLALGGEYGGALTYLAEHVRDERRGLYTGMLQATATFGFVLALLVVFSATHMLDSQSFANWGWRIPFLFSALLVIVSLFVRLRIGESPVFVKLAASAGPKRSPVRETLFSLRSWRAIGLALFGATGAQTVAWYTVHVYALIFMQQTLKIDIETSTICAASALLIAVPFYALSGWLSDRHGRARIIRFGFVGCAIVLVPGFAALSRYAPSGNWAGVIAAIATMAIVVTLISAPTGAFMVELFPARIRTTGVSVANQIGNVLFGGFLPLIAVTTSHWLHNPYGGLAFPIVVLCVSAIVNRLFCAPLDRAGTCNRLEGAQAEQEVHQFTDHQRG